MRQRGRQGAFLGKGWKAGSTRQNPLHTAAPDLVCRDFRADAPNQLWVAETTTGDRGSLRTETRSQPGLDQIGVTVSSGERHESRQLCGTRSLATSSHKAGHTAVTASPRCDQRLRTVRT